MDELYDELKRIFNRANEKLIRFNLELFENNVAERTLCGALMLCLYEELKNTNFFNYHVDVEYNRNKGGKLKWNKKTILEQNSVIIPINCDLIVHSRGKNLQQDNLIAIEMKKSYRPKKDKDKDRLRLECLTKDYFYDVESYNSEILPEHVCRYVIGIYYEIDYKQRKILLEYYYQGERVALETISLSL